MSLVTSLMGGDTVNASGTAGQQTINWMGQDSNPQAGASKLGQKHSLHFACIFRKKQSATGASTWWLWQSPQADNEKVTHKEGGESVRWLVVHTGQYMYWVMVWCARYIKRFLYIAVSNAPNDFTLYFRGRPVRSNTISTSLGSRMLQLMHKGCSLHTHIYLCV